MGRLPLHHSPAQEGVKYAIHISLHRLLHIMEVKYTLEVTLSLSVNYIVRRTCWRKIFYFLNISKDQAASKNNCKGENESFPEDSRSLAPKWINQTNLVSCTCYNLPATCNPFCWQSISESEKKIVVSLYSFDMCFAVLTIF